MKLAGSSCKEFMVVGRSRDARRVTLEAGLQQKECVGMTSPPQEVGPPLCPKTPSLEYEAEQGGRSHCREKRRQVPRPDS